MTGSELPKARATFKARYVHALRLILDRAQEHQFERSVGLLVEPVETGVLLIATDGKVIGVFHDKDGQANKPFRAMLRKVVRDACAPPVHIKTFSEGDTLEYALPEWTYPDLVILFGAGAYIQARMPHPSDDGRGGPFLLGHAMIETGNVWREDDYRIDEKPLWDWRKAFDRPRGPAATCNLSPKLFATFQPIIEYGIDEDGVLPAITVEMSAGGDSGVHIITIDGVPNFIGAIAPMKPCEPMPRPAWLARGGK